MKKTEFSVKVKGEEQKFIIREPGDRLKREASEHKAEVFKREAFKKDENGKLIAVFADQVYNLMREKGLWSDEDEAELKKVSEELDSKIALLSKGKTAEVDTVAKLRDVVINQVKELRSKQFKLLAKSNKFHEISVEAVCNEAENDYLTCFSTFSVNEESGGDGPAFTSLEDYKNADPDLKEEASRQMAIMLGTNDPDWFLKLPENKILLKHKLIDEKGHYILNGVRVNIDGKKINEKGFLINDNGEPIDENGNLTDENGEPLDYTPFDEEVV